MKLKDKKLFLLDMDGTIYIDDCLFEGTEEFLQEVKRRGKYLFLTNNSSRGVEGYIQKMERLGIKATRDDFLTSVDATVDLLRQRYGSEAGGKKIYLLGTASFRSQMEDAGFLIADNADDDVSILLAGFDRELTYKKLEDACILLGRGVEYFATNPDWVCPTVFGYVPDCGSICQMLEHATGRKPEIIGKPEARMVLMALSMFGYRSEEAVLIGDRLYTDIACGVNGGIDTIFVLSGEGTLDDLESSPVKPTYVIENISQVLKEIQG